MPSLPRRQRRQPAAEALAELDPDLRRDLETGHSFFERYETIEDMRAAWNAVGDELTNEFIRQHPGTRPFAWWILEHKQERPINPDGGADDKHLAQLRREARFGFLDTRIWLSRLIPIQEDQTFYLQRSGLLTDDELSRIPFEEPDDDTIDMGQRILNVSHRGPRLKRP